VGRRKGDNQKVVENYQIKSDFNLSSSVVDSGRNLELAKRA
jgi:hypothetical protein